LLHNTAYGQQTAVAEKTLALLLLLLLAAVSCHECIVRFGFAQRILDKLYAGTD
jgi:hypothetical protein